MSQEINPGPDTLIYSVEKVKLEPIEEDSNPIAVKITAKGTVRSGGWKNPQLIPIAHVLPPEDGIWHFSFTAEPPTGTVTQDMPSITAVDIMENVPDGFNGVRVLAETNYIEVALR